MRKSRSGVYSPGVQAALLGLMLALCLCSSGRATDGKKIAEKAKSSAQHALTPTKNGEFSAATKQAPSKDSSAGTHPTGNADYIDEALANRDFPLYQKRYDALLSRIKAWQEDYSKLLKETGISWPPKLWDLGYALGGLRVQMRVYGPALRVFPKLSSLPPNHEYFERTMRRLAAERKAKGAFVKPPAENFSVENMKLGMEQMALGELLVSFGEKVNDLIKHPGKDRLFTADELLFEAMKRMETEYGKEARALWVPDSTDRYGLHGPEFARSLSRWFDGTGEPLERQARVASLMVPVSKYVKLIQEPIIREYSSLRAEPEDQKQ